LVIYIIGFCKIIQIIQTFNDNIQVSAILSLYAVPFVDPFLGLGTGDITDRTPEGLAIKFPPSDMISNAGNVPNPKNIIYKDPLKGFVEISAPASAM
jgi:hypothetical protein